MSGAQQPSSPPPRPRRRWGRRWLIAGLALLALLAAAPTLLLLPPVRDALIGLASRDVNGRLTVRRLDAGWIRPLEVEGLALAPHDGRPLARVEAIRHDRSLLGLLWSVGDLGRVDVHRPELRLEIRPDGSNLRDVLGKLLDPKPDAATGLTPPPVTLKFQVHDARVAVRGPKSSADWVIERIQIAGGLRPPLRSELTGLEFYLEPGRLVDHAPLTPEMCGDALKYVAPVLADATEVEGSITLDLEQFAVPFAQPLDSEVRGKLVFHSATVGAGPLVQRLAALLRVEPRVALARDGEVRFDVRGRTVHHEELQFGLGDAVEVKTSGRVGFDQSLHLLAEVRVVLSEDDQPALPLIEALRSQPVRLEIGGTLREPEVRASALIQSSLGLLEEWLRRRADRDPAAPAPKPTVKGLLDRLRPKPP